MLLIESGQFESTPMSITEKISALLKQMPELADLAQDGKMGSAERKSEPARKLKEMLADLHSADIADLLESIPFGQRVLVWALLPKGRYGKVLMEVSESVLEMLASEMGESDLAGALKGLDVSDVAYILRRLPDDERARLMRLADLTEDKDLRASLSFGEDTVGEVMDFNPVIFHEGKMAGQIISRLRKMGELPSHCDKLFIIGDRGRLAGVLPLKRLLISPKESQMSEVMVKQNIYSFRATDSIEYVASAFEKYDLVSAPVVNSLQQVVGRITIDEIVTYLEEQRNKGMMISTGISEEEDLFAPIFRRFRNRWVWLIVNMVAAFAVSRMVGLFEDTIERLVALAALMPIIASLSGNAGIQTATLMVRALALEHVNKGALAIMLFNELRLSTLNGVVGGLLAAGFGYLFYQSIALCTILFASMVSAFMIAALAGFAIPIVMDAIGKDPALGSSVVLTVITDCASFFVFLGLGAIFLT